MAFAREPVFSLAALDAAWMSDRRLLSGESCFSVRGYPVVGSSDSGALKALQDAVSKAKQEAYLALVGDRLDSCTQFVVRARKRLEKADECLIKSQNHLARLSEGQRRLDALRVEAAAAIPPQVLADPVSLEAEIWRMQEGSSTMCAENEQRGRALPPPADALQLT